MSHRFRLVPLIAVIALSLPPMSARAFGQSRFADVASVKAEVVPAQAKRGQTVTYKFTLEPKAGYHTYPVRPKVQQDSKTALEAPRPDVLVFVSEPREPAAEWWETELDPLVGSLVQSTTKAVTWEFTAVVSPNAKPGSHSVKLGKTSFVQVCKGSCIPMPPSDIPGASIEVLADEVPVDSQLVSAVARALEQIQPQPKGPTPVPTPKDDNRGPNNLGGNESKPVEDGHQTREAKPIEQVEAQLNAILERLDRSEVSGQRQEPSLGAFVLTAAIWGLVSLVTPCVFPMIPITVSIFLKHAHGSFRERMKLAGVYCITIISVLGVSAFALLKFMAWLSVHPVTNVLLGALFVVLALSLFGLYELTLPSFMVKRLQTKQTQGGVTGTIFGALAFTVISFTCVAPFLGGFAGISAAGAGETSLIAIPRTREILGGLAFATAFAAPFFILAMVPGLLKALPKSGGWLDSVKVVMGFLELAAALKFFRTAELGVFSPAQYFTFDLVLAGWVGITLACGLYLLNAYRLPHDEEKPNIGVIRLMFALLFLGLSVYLFPGLFKGPDGKAQRPAGAVFAWVDAFLLPEPKHLGWSFDLHDTIERVRADAAKTGKMRPIFIDFTGETCTNCRYNENNVFPQPKVNELLEQFVRVQLYTDWVPASSFETDPGTHARRLEGLANQDFLNRAFGTIQLPLYVTLLPRADGTVKVLGVYEEGKINQPDQFAAWLKEALAKAKK